MPASATQQIAKLDGLFVKATKSNTEEDWTIYLNERDAFQTYNAALITPRKFNAPNSYGVTINDALNGDPYKVSLNELRRWRKSLYHVDIPRDQLVTRYIELTNILTESD